MEDKIIEYITGNGEQNTETIKPQYITSNTFDVQQMQYNKGIITNDNDYYIRYGGSYGNYQAIEVYSNNSLDNNEPLYVFDNIKIAGNGLRMLCLKQDEDGRFYGIGWNYNGTLNEWFLILFNNFIQDGQCIIRKYYNFTQIGISNIGTSPEINKEEGEATYYILDSAYNKIYSFNINITNGNTLKTYNFTYSTPFADSYSIAKRLYINGKSLIYLFERRDEENNKIECGKLVIDTTQEIKDNYNTEVVYTEQNNNINGMKIENYNWSILYKISNGNNYNIRLRRIDLLGNSTIYNSDYLIPNFNYSNVFNNYIIARDIDAQFMFFFIIKDNTIQHFKTLELAGNFTDPNIIGKYNLLYIVGMNSTSRMIYIKNIYSQGYSSTPYYNNNFLIPQYINLYGNANDNTSVIFSRDVSNRFLADNQLSVIYNVPNYMLNNVIVQRQDILGQTNQTIEGNNINLSKNRFESLYVNYIYSMYVTDNTNGNNLSNSGGANRVANSFWNALDFNNSKVAKARVTHEDGSQTILSLGTANILNNEATFEYEVSRQYK